MIRLEDAIEDVKKAIETAEIRGSDLTKCYDKDTRNIDIQSDLLLTCCLLSYSTTVHLVHYAGSLSRKEYGEILSLFDKAESYVAGTSFAKDIAESKKRVEETYRENPDALQEEWEARYLTASA